MKPLGHAIDAAHACNRLQNAPNARAHDHLENSHELRTVAEARRQTRSLYCCKVLLTANAFLHLQQRSRRLYEKRCAGLRRDVPIRRVVLMSATTWAWRTVNVC